jgi:hypothetical protein
MRPGIMGLIIDLSNRLCYRHRLEVGMRSQIFLIILSFFIGSAVVQAGEKLSGVIYSEDFMDHGSYDGCRLYFTDGANPSFSIKMLVKLKTLNSSKRTVKGELIECDDALDKCFKTATDFVVLNLVESQDAISLSLKSLKPNSLDSTLIVENLTFVRGESRASAQVKSIRHDGKIEFQNSCPFSKRLAVP